MSINLSNLNMFPILSLNQTRFESPIITERNITISNEKSSFSQSSDVHTCIHTYIHQFFPCTTKMKKCACVPVCVLVFFLCFINYSIIIIIIIMIIIHYLLKSVISIIHLLFTFSLSFFLPLPLLSFFTSISRANLLLRVVLPTKN